MLHIIDNYYASSNNYGYTVVKKTDRKDKDGNPVQATLGYVGTLKEVVTLVCKDMLHNRITDGYMELKQALEFIKEQEDRINEMLKGVEI